MGLENGILDTPTARQTTITLANASRQPSTTTHVSAAALRIMNLLNANVSTYHDCGNLSIPSEPYTSTEDRNIK